VAPSSGRPASRPGIDADCGPLPAAERWTPVAQLAHGASGAQPAHPAGAITASAIASACRSLASPGCETGTPRAARKRGTP